MTPSSALPRVRRLVLALLLLAVPACSLSDYEELMRDSQEREARFREEQKYLDQPIQIPMRKNDEGQDVALANVFFRPPKGIEPKPQQRDDLMWVYSAGKRAGDFLSVEMAFADKDEDFTHKVLDRYVSGQPASTPRQVTAPGQTTPTVFDLWEFSNGQKGYSINILRGSAKPIAIVYIYNKSRFESARKAIELSLQSLGVDQQVLAARQRSTQKSPWKLKGEPSP